MGNNSNKRQLYRLPQRHFFVPSSADSILCIDFIMRIAVDTSVIAYTDSHTEIQSNGDKFPQYLIDVFSIEVFVHIGVCVFVLFFRPFSFSFLHISTAVITVNTSDSMIIFHLYSPLPHPQSHQDAQCVKRQNK